MKRIFVLSGLVLFLAGCDILATSDSSDKDFFPLKVGQQWTYRITESDMDTSRIGFPKQFTVSVAGELTVENKRYYLVTNYFVPGPTLPDTIMVRSTGNRVYTRFSPEEDELLFYAFTPIDTTWSVPMYAGASTIYPRSAILKVRRNSTAAISWDLYGYPDSPPFVPGRSESGWGETFERGIGRTEIVSVSQGYGKVVWTLE